LFPLGPFLLKSKQLFGLLSLSASALSIKLLQPQLVVFTLLIKLSLIVSDASISLGLQLVEFLLQAGFSLQCFLKALFKRSLFTQLGFALELALFKKDLLITLEFLV